ncbi:DUF1893 domain-containing protein [Bacteroides zoogleoformans]|uniref:DUF1893 domain-containing protein n=1 Tax=Bacteroides zoogleoformans TaxID=28119 RepID=UPI00248D5A9A|nr:DUF1893 domain-containing protein [Bacteroides zoogleoformans]
MKSIIDMLHKGGYSCVMRKDKEIRAFSRRGVMDLYDLYQADPAFMRGAAIADKIIGKGAAALIVLGGIKSVYADVISSPAVKLLHESGVNVTFAEEVPHIINRSGTGQCPLEDACCGLEAVEDMFPAIRNFIFQIRSIPQ